MFLPVAHAATYGDFEDHDPDPGGSTSGGVGHLVHQHADSDAQLSV